MNTEEKVDSKIETPGILFQNEIMPNNGLFEEYKQKYNYWKKKIRS